MTNLYLFRYDGCQVSEFILTAWMVAIMFLRKHEVKHGEKLYTSYRLCRTVREGSKVRQEIVANLGKLSAKEAERIGRQLLTISGTAAPDTLRTGPAQQGPAYLYGGPLLVQRLIDMAGFGPLLERFGNTRRRLDLRRTLTVSLCAQLLAPGSELATTSWQEKLLSTREPYQIPYEHFLRALDVLADHHPQIEDHLFGQVKHLFNQQLDVVFYDLTSSYFEGDGPHELAKRGYSRDGRGDRPQIVLGIAVTKEGFPIAYRVHPGNTVDAKTVQAITTDFRQRFEIDRCLVVGDSGLLSKENAEALHTLGLNYLMGMRAATTTRAQEVILATRELDPAGQLGEVSYWAPIIRDGKAHIVLHSPGRHKKTTAIAERKLALVRPKLQQLERDVKAGKARAEKTIAARATKILTEAKASPLIDVQVAHGQFSWSANSAKLNFIREHGGKYVLQTNQLDIQAQEAAIAYRQLEVVENSIRHLKDTLGLRPVFHRNPHRVIGHVGVCVIALFLLRLLENRLLTHGICDAAQQAIDTAQQLLAIPIQLNGTTLWPLPHVSTHAKAVFRALGIADVKHQFQEDLQALGLTADS